MGTYAAPGAKPTMGGAGSGGSLVGFESVRVRARIASLSAESVDWRDTGTGTGTGHKTQSTRIDTDKERHAPPFHISSV